MQERNKKTESHNQEQMQKADKKESSQQQSKREQSKQRKDSDSPVMMDSENVSESVEEVDEDGIMKESKVQTMTKKYRT